MDVPETFIRISVIRITVFKFEFRLEREKRQIVVWGCVLKWMDHIRQKPATKIQILDNHDPKYAKLKPYQYHGSIYGKVPAKRGF